MAKNYRPALRRHTKRRLARSQFLARCALAEPVVPLASQLNDQGCLGGTSPDVRRHIGASGWLSRAETTGDGALMARAQLAAVAGRRRVAAPARPQPPCLAVRAPRRAGCGIRPVGE